jgi:hypothetical protein
VEDSEPQDPFNDPFFIADKLALRCYSFDRSLGIVEIGTKKKLVAAVAAVVVGALGSALWDVVLKPAGQWLGNAVLTAATFGSTTIKNQVYAEAAKGPHENAALVVVGLLAGCVFSAPIVLGFLIFTLRVRFRKLLLSTSHADGSFRDRSDQVRSRPVPIEQRIERVRRLFWLLYAFTALLLFTVGTFGVQILKVIESNEVYSFYRQSMRICRPYLG